MRRLPWLSGVRETRSLRAALLPLGGLAQSYRGAAQLNRWLHENRWLPSRRLPCCVVSVGSLLIGGSGKTPLAATLARGLQRRGLKVVLASRGYGRRSQEPVTVVSDGHRLYALEGRAGDEPMVLARHAHGVPVLVGSDRSVVGLRAISAFDADVVLLDDGFQHHRLARDVEIVAFDADLGLANRKVLPRGPLREGVAALSRADVICVVDGVLGAEDRAIVQRHAPGARSVRARRRPTGLRRHGDSSCLAIGDLDGARVGLLAGIGHPPGFRHTLEGLGAHIVAERIYPDHHRYSSEDLRGLGARAAIWVTTEKDAVKILPSWTGDLDLCVLDIEVQLDDEEAFVSWLETRALKSLSCQRAPVEPQDSLLDHRLY